MKENEITIARLIDAPRELVWKAWTDPEEIDKWWGPNGFTNTTKSISVKVGGTWRFTMHGPGGVDYPNRIRYTEIKEPERIAYDHDSDKDGDPEGFKSIVTFEAVGKQTRVTLTAIFKDKATRDMVVEKAGAIEGGKQTLGKLAAYVEKKEVQR